MKKKEYENCDVIKELRKQAEYDVILANFKIDIQNLSNQLQKVLGKIRSLDIDIEKLSELEHSQWWSYSKNISETENISEERLNRWKECWKPYSELTEEQKEQDRIWARKVLELLKNENTD
jgi:hypothetical protein